MPDLLNIIACAVCVGMGSEHQDTVALSYAILFLLLVIVPLLTMIIFFFVRIAKREKQAMIDKSQPY